MFEALIVNFLVVMGLLGLVLLGGRLRDMRESYRKSMMFASGLQLLGEFMNKGESKNEVE